MVKKTLKTISMLIGFGIIAVTAALWKQFVEMGDQISGKGTGYLAAICAIIVAAVVAVMLHTLVSRIIAPKAPALWNLSPEERRKVAEAAAEEAIREKHLGEAMRIYEEAGLFIKALEVAEKANDAAAQARYSLRLNRYPRARKLYVQTRDFASAGHVSLLMNETKEAREFYTKAAEACRERHGKPGEEASFWDRAAEYAKAAHLYEEGGELGKAAECHELMGDQRNAIRCGDQAKAVQAFERRMSGHSLTEMERQAERRKAAAAKQADDQMAKGDFFGAGEQYRAAEKMMDAAIAFERAEEWKRAAKCYEAAGLPDRAELAMMHVAAAEKAAQSAEAGASISGMAPPSPDSAASKAFNPITQARAVPVYLAASGQEILDAAAQEEMLRMVRQGKFREAAQKAGAAGNWLLAGALYECTGALIQAADTYRQVGRTDEAVECLTRAGRAKDAAMMSLAEGRQERAVESLVTALEGPQAPDQSPEQAAREATGQPPAQRAEEAGWLLLELLADWGKPDDALALMRARIAPGEINPGNALLYYKFARLMESKNHFQAALQVYRELVGAGAESPDIEARMNALEQKIAQEAATGEKASAKTHSPLTSKQEEVIGELVSRAIESASRLEAIPGVAFAPGETADKTATFLFNAEAVETANPWDSWSEGEAAAGGVGFPVGSVSLFGGPEKAAEDGAAPGAAQTDPFDASRRYEKKREIARGGMGVVYEALDTMLQRPIALKLILDPGSANQQDLQQFLLEARAIAQLSHPNVVMIYDIGLMGLRHYIAMELVKGGSLSKVIKEEKQLSIAEAVRIFVETARGLQAAHEAGIVHRDIKPGNVLLTEKRQVKIVDFGLAKFSQKESGMPDKTIFRSSGTPGYMAPEQIRGEKMQPRSDIYALGITLFDMLVGKPPHKVANIANEFEILKFQVDGALPSLKELRPDVPDALDQMYRFCTAAEPDERYQSIDAFLDTAENWLLKLKT